MKFNKWTLGLAALGVVSLASVAQAEEKSNPVMTALSSTTISGYVDTSMIWKFGSSYQNGVGGGLPGRVFDGQNKQNGFNLNAVGLVIEKPLDEAQWAAGYKVDMMLGPDAAPLANWAVGASDFALKQAYVVLRAPVGNGLDFKIGTFDSGIGYEATESYKNPNYSRSYGYSLNPKSLTGLQISYKFADFLSASAGIANSATGGINARPLRSGYGATQMGEWEKTYFANITLTAPESFGFAAGSQLYAGVINGLGNGVNPALGAPVANAFVVWDGQSPTDVTWFYVGGTLNTPVKGLALGGAWDYRTTKHSDAMGFPGTYAWATAGYVTYQATEKLKLSARGELAKGTVNTWYTVNALESDPQNYLLGVTTTVDYSLWANVITRLEFRWDHDLTTQHPDANNVGTIDSLGNATYIGGPFNYDDRNVMSIALNVIYKF